MPGKMSARVSCGRDFHCCPDINTALDSACKSGFDFVCLSIVNPRFKRESIVGPAKSRCGALTRSDLSLTSQDWNSLIVGKLSPWIDPDSKVEHVRKNSEAALKQELNYGSHLGLPAVLVQLRDANCVNLAGCLYEHLLTGYFQQQFWIQIPLITLRDQADKLVEGMPKVNSNSIQDDTWEWWHTFRSLVDNNKRIGVALELTSDLPDMCVLNRWLSEPVKAVIVSTSLFLTNKKGYPVLSKAHQNFLRQLFKLEVQLILTGVDRHPGKGIHSYQQYLDHLWQTQPSPDTVSQFARGYEDYLQCPLQPLMDNLESQTYEIFEKDPVKYTQYQKAIFCALLDKIKPEEKDTMDIVLMVVGAGRGPLVRASLTAAAQAQRKIRKIYAVEKNPNAVVTLENLREEMWGEQVEVVSCDMREWVAPEKADIIVSELLGSFGDNELSPECLDGAQRFLKEDGISIPSEYTSYLAPLQSAKLYNEVRSCKEREKPIETNFEMPYVVRLHSCQILAQPQAVFNFKHPNKDPVFDNSRFISLQFDIDKNCVLHGFAGYFEAVLYKDVNLSILPATHSPGMFSWFPILFPIRKWRKGQRVYSKWKDCKTYPGKVKAVNHDDDTLMIEFDDGIIYRVNAALVSRKLPGAVSSVKQKDDIEKKDVPKPYNIIATSGHTKNSNNQSMDILANEKTQIGNFKENVETNVETNRICNTMGQSEAMDTENDDPTDVTRTNTDFEHLEENNTMLTIATTVTEIANGKENNYVDYTGEITLSSSDEEELDQYYNSESEYKPSKESEASDESDLELNESHFEGSEKDKFNNNETDSETDNSLQNSDVASPQTNANPQKQSAAMAKSDLLSNKQHAEVASCKSFSSIHVMTTSNDVGARKWDKKAYCLYCEKAYSKLTRHLTTMHTNESEVARYLGEADGKKKTAMLCKLRNLGNHVHNCAVLRRGEGSLLVSYRPSKFASAHSYTPCEYCYGYYAKYELWRHKCPLKPVSSTKGKLRQRVLSKSRMLLPTPPEANAVLTEVLAAMRSDEVSRVCKSDTLILQLARKETFRVGHEKDSHNYIRSKMRELGRLLVCLRTRTGLYNSSLQDFIEPTKFKDVVEAAREVSQFNEVTHEYATPSLALKLGHTLKKCAKIMKGNALQCGDVETTTRADAFSTLCELKWTDEVSSHALRTLQLKKRNSVMILPLANDVKVLTKHLQDQTLIRRTILVSETASIEERKAAWSTLNEITLTQIILFNRRRQGEVSRIEVSQYSKKHAAAQGDIGEMLSTIEQGLCKLFARLEIKGKRGSTVPVLLTSSVQESLDLLIQNRAIAGVDPKNVYLFARSNYGSMGHIRGSDCLRQFSSQCGALHPEHIRSTKLRKHVATMSQILNLQEQEMDLLAQFMGHDIRVHRQYYRLPEGTLQVAKLSKLLLAMENGTMANNAGKRLEDIDIQPDEEIQHDDDSAESDNESDDENTVMDASKYQPMEREIENIKVAVPRGCSLAKRTSVKRRLWTEEEKAATPVYLKKDCRILVDFWRRCSPKNVWYEWTLREPQVLPIHNPKGRSYTIGL